MFPIKLKDSKEYQKVKVVSEKVKTYNNNIKIEKLIKQDKNISKYIKDKYKNL